MKDKQSTVADQAAEAFYGQDPIKFAKDVDDIAGHDPRLLALFHRTREHYLEDRF